MPWERLESIVPSPELPIIYNPNKLIEEQVLVWVVSDQPCVWLVGVPKTQVMITLQEGRVWLSLRPYHGVDV